MRAWIFLILTAAFVTAVILPNDVGTDDLPATGARHVVVKSGRHAMQPDKADLMGCVVVQLNWTAHCGGIAQARLCTAPCARLQSSLPLLI